MQDFEKLYKRRSRRKNDSEAVREIVKILKSGFRPMVALLLIVTVMKSRL